MRSSNGNGAEAAGLAAARILGLLIRELRESYSLTRRQLATEARISYADQLGVEEGRIALTAWKMRRLLAHPSMALLIERASAAGVELPPEVRSEPRAKRGGTGGGSEGDGGGLQGDGT